jgi:hypothetical protein
MDVVPTALSWRSPANPHYWLRMPPRLSQLLNNQPYTLHCEPHYLLQLPAWNGRVSHSSKLENSSANPLLPLNGRGSCSSKLENSSANPLLAANATPLLFITQQSTLF